MDHKAMKKITKEKLKKIADLYPEERLEKSKKRLQQVWNGNLGNLDRYPFTYNPFIINYYDVIETPENRLQNSLDGFIARGVIEDDFIPSLFPGCSTATIPNMFGAEELVVGGDYSSEQIIHSESDINSLPEPVLGDIANRWLTMQKYFLEETEGEIPIHISDMQGAGDVCGAMWSYQDMMLAAYDNPEVVSLLLRKTSDAFLLLWKTQAELLKDCFQPTHLFAWNWMPLKDIATVSCDSMVMISSEFFEKFYVPYLEYISKNFSDGIVVHSCGDFSSLVKTLCNIDFIRGVNAGEMKLPELANAGFDKSTTMMCVADYKDVEEAFKIIYDKELCVDLTIAGLWDDSSYAPLNPVEVREWSEDKFKQIKDKHRVIERYALELAENLRKELIL